MIRLSRRAWNNVIIFAMLLMIVLFNSTHNILTGSMGEDEISAPLLPADSVLMTLDFSGQKIERIGRGWRLRPAESVAEADLAELVNAWHSTNMARTEDYPEAEPLIVVVWLAGESKGRVYQFYSTDDGGLNVEIDNLHYRIIDKQPSELMLPGVF